MAFACLVGLRFFFFSENIDEPHSWRQYDTAQYARSLAFDEFDLMHPKVAWMGGHKDLILEFPLPEAITAVFYKALGEDLIWGRLVTLFFFAGAALYFRAILRLVSSTGLADLSTLIFMVLPLGIPYSRALHVDPAALFFAHAACYHALIGIRSESKVQLMTASLMAVFAALIKIPYLFYLALPILFFIWKEGKLKKAWTYLPFLAPCGIIFSWWMWHTHRVNDSAPEWEFIPQYHKFVDMGGWYFSTLDIRFMGDLWETILRRVKFEVMGGFFGYLPAGLSLFLGWRVPGSGFMRVWLSGCILYLLIFFPLNVVHNYYQLPFLAPAAFFISAAILWLAEEVGKVGPYAKTIAVSLSVLLFAGNSLRLVTRTGLKGQEKDSFANYFTVDPAFSSFGQAVRGVVPSQDLLIVSYGGLDCRAPHLLYESGHYGWSIPTKQLNIELIRNLQAEGAKHLAVMDKPNAGQAFQAGCDSLFEVEIMKVNAREGLPEKEVRIYHLDRLRR